MEREEEIRHARAYRRALRQSPLTEEASRECLMKYAVENRLDPNGRVYRGCRAYTSIRIAQIEAGVAVRQRPTR